MARVVIALALSMFLIACSDDSAAPMAPSGPPTGTLSGNLMSGSFSVRGVVFITAGPNSPRVTSTDTLGAYQFTGLAPGRVTLRANANSFQSVLMEVALTGTNIVNFSLAELPKGTLSGTVSDVETGAPISGATVTILFDATTDGRLEFNRTASTDGAGLYRFENITLGNLNFSVTAPGYGERRAGANIRVMPVLNVALQTSRPSVPENNRTEPGGR